MSEVSSTESNPPADPELSCPRCGCPLALDRLRQPPETFEVQRCPTCRGMFLETSKLRALESTFEVSAPGVDPADAEAGRNVVRQSDAIGRSGLARRFLDGTASSKQAESAGAGAMELSQKAWEQIEKPGG